MKLAIDLKGTIAKHKEFVSDEMLTYLKDAVLITGQDMKDPQLANLMERIKIPVWSNNGAILWDGNVKIVECLIPDKDNLLSLVNKFVSLANIPLHESPKVWSDVQISLWCKDISLKERNKIAMELEAFLDDDKIYVCASGMNTIAIYNRKANKADSIVGCDTYIGDEFAYGNDKEVASTSVRCYSCDPIEYKDDIPLNVTYIGAGPDAVKSFLDSPKQVYYPRILFPYPTEGQIKDIFHLRLNKANSIGYNIYYKLLSLPPNSILSAMPKRADRTDTHVFTRVVQEVSYQLNIPVIPEEDFFEIYSRKSMIDIEIDAERKEAIEKADARYIGTSLEGKTVFILDDIVSTGTSLMNAARILLNTGATQVFPIGLIQAPYPAWEKEKFDAIINSRTSV